MATPNKQGGWAVMFIIWNFALLVAILVLLFQLHLERVDAGTIANACAQAAVNAVTSLK